MRTNSELFHDHQFRIPDDSVWPLSIAISKLNDMSSRAIQSVQKNWNHLFISLLNSMNPYSLNCILSPICASVFFILCIWARPLHITIIHREKKGSKEHSWSTWPLRSSSLSVVYTPIALPSFLMPSTILETASRLDWPGTLKRYQAKGVINNIHTATGDFLY